MKTLLSIVLFLFLHPYCYSQSDNIKKYLDDGGRTDSNNLIKTDIAEILLGNYQVIWEHQFTRNFAVQGGVGFLTGKSVLRPLIVESSLYRHLHGGFSLFVSPVYYFGDLEAFHYSLPVQYKRYGNQASSLDFSFCIGKQWFLNEYLTLDVQGGIGVTIEKSLDGTSYVYNKNAIDEQLRDGSWLYLPLSIKIGYLL